MGNCCARDAPCPDDGRLVEGRELAGTGQHLRGGTGTGDALMGCSAGSGPTGSSVEEVGR